ncbi:MAG: hypothetical protein M3N56_01900 [Actinomycetota bacterium]|nr:hypothetical protein [Actinomycetota bacterium]
MSQRMRVGDGHGHRPRASYGACADLRDKQIVLTFYVAPDLTDDERDDLYAVGAMVTADSADDYDVIDRLIEVTGRREPLATAGTWLLLQRDFLTVET